MHKVIFSLEAISMVQSYIRRYRLYYEELYSDSGLWNEDMIIEGYRAEAIKRYEEIFDIIEVHLEKEIVSYMRDETIIKWRSRVLLVSFEDEGNIRTITHIQIR
jgi:hypothetical protein